MTSPATSSAELTVLLNRMLLGDQDAGDLALAELQGMLRRAASVRLRRERPGHLLDTGALVNEALVRLFRTKSVTVQNRQHFVALVCLLMKRVLIDFGRRHDPVFSSLEESMAVMSTPRREEFLTIERILDRFASVDPDGSQAFRLTFTTGMTAIEVADSLGCSVPTIHRRLRRSRAWMFKELTALFGDRHSN